MKYAQNGYLNTWISGVRSSGDYVDYNGPTDFYADIYRVNIPTNGYLTIMTNGTDPEDGDDSYPTIKVYNNKTDEIYKRWFYYANYNSAYDYRYDSIAVSGGTYYVEIYEGSSEYQLYLGYKPSVAKTFISKVKAKKKALHVTWKRCNGVLGYQLQYSKKKSISNPKTITVGNDKNSTKIKGLKRRKKYYLRIRTYKKVSGKIYYSAWSSKVSKKTK